MRYAEIISEHSLGKLYKYDGIEAVGYWYNPTNGKHATIAWEAADGVNAHSDHADYPWDNPEFFGITKDQLEDWGDTDEIRAGLVLKGWARIGYNTKMGMRVDVKNAKTAQRAIQWFAQHHGVPHAVGVGIWTGARSSGNEHFNLKGDQVTEFMERGRLEPAWKLER